MAIINSELLVENHTICETGTVMGVEDLGSYSCGLPSWDARRCGSYATYDGGYIITKLFNTGGNHWDPCAHQLGLTEVILDTGVKISAKHLNVRITATQIPPTVRENLSIDLRDQHR